MAITVMSHLARAVVALFLVALALGSDIPAARAQDVGATSTTGPAVSLVGTGGAIRAAGANVVIAGTASSVQAAGARVEINADVSGPVRAAGAQVTIDGSVGGALKAAGEFVDVRGRFADVYLAGAVVRFNGATTGSLKAGAATIDIGAGTDIAGGLSAAAADVTVAGHIRGPVELGGAVVTFNGAADGNVIADADTVTIGPNATIGGDLIVRSHAAPVIAEGARITGQVLLQEPALWWQIPRWVWKGIFAVIMAGGAVLTGIVLLAAGRATFEEALAHAAFRPLSSGLIGLATLIVLPIVAALLMATVFGLTFGLALLLVLPFLAVAGHAVVATCVGVWTFDRSGGPRSAGRLFLYLLGGAIVIALVWLIPWAGPIATSLALLVGTGAYVRSLGARLRRAPVKPV